MARGKRAAKELSPEEKLQQALVPVEEQSYLVPENWCWVRLGSLLNEIKNGTTIKQDKSGSGYWVTRIESLQNQTIDFNRLGSIVNECDIKDNDWYMAGDIALSHINSADHVGKTALINADMLPLVHGMNLLRLRFNESCIPTFFQYYSQSFQYKEEILARINMAVNQVSINQKQLRSLEFPLPPLPEQHRIVFRIESLFSKLDEAKEKAQAVVEGFELRKSAILHKAFTGELTEQWRKENGVGLDSWTNTIFKSILDVRDGTHDSPEYVDVGYALVTSKNLKDGKITDKNLKYISQDNYNKINARSKVDIGDILFAMIGTIGNPVVIKDKPNYAIKNVALFKNIKKVNPYFVKYYLETKEVRDKMDRDAKGSTQRFVSLEYLRNFPIPIPTEAEQIELVARVDNLLEKEQQAKEAAEAVLSRIDTMKKSILARAFRGELGTNDPAEESSVELIKAVL